MNKYQPNKQPPGRPLKGYPPPFDCTATELASKIFAAAKPTVSVKPKPRRKRR